MQPSIYVSATTALNYFSAVDVTRPDLIFGKSEKLGQAGVTSACLVYARYAWCSGGCRQVGLWPFNL